MVTSPPTGRSSVLDMDQSEESLSNNDIPNYNNGIVLTEGQTFDPGEPLFIVPPPDESEAAVLSIDKGIDQCIQAFADIEKSVEYLRTKLEHPDQLDALKQIDDLLTDALAPYLEELAQQLARITDAV